MLDDKEKTKMKITLLTIFILLFNFQALAAITECIGKNGDLYFTDDFRCPDGYKNTKPAQSDFKPNYLKNEDYVSKGCAGGFTGAGASAIITRSGKVLSQEIVVGPWPAPIESRNIGAVVNPLFEKLDKISFLTIDHNYPKNMTCFISARISGNYNKITLDKQTPKNVRDLVELFDSLAHKF